MDGTSPAAAAILERVLLYLDGKSVAACAGVNKPWHALATLQSARRIECHVAQLPLRIARSRRRGLLGSVREVDVDVSFPDGFLAARQYERRLQDAARALQGAGHVRRLRLHAAALGAAPSDDEIRFGALAVRVLADALPGVAALDVGDCPAALLARGQFAGLRRLRRLRWFALGRNDRSSAAALAHVVAANVATLAELDARADVSDRVARMLCGAPHLARLNASGSPLSDDALLALVRARGARITHLELSDCARLTRLSVGQLTPRLLPRLAALDLYNVAAGMDTYAAVFHAHAHWPCLRDLKLKPVAAAPRRLGRAGDEMLEAIASNCPRLVALRLFGCHGITDAGLSAVLGSLGHLRELVVMHQPEDPVALDGDDSPEPPAQGAAASTDTNAAPGGLLLSLPSINDLWASMPALPSNALPQHTRNRAPAAAPDTPCLSDQPTSAGHRPFTSQALRRGVRSQRFNLLNLDMAYDSACAEHLAKLSHLHTL
ncbi:hypothetical protein LPJ70_005988, partial [Coemansia sp. RSA 2708]